MNPGSKQGFSTGSTPRSTIGSTWSLGGRPQCRPPGRPGPGRENSSTFYAGVWIRISNSNFELFSILKIPETSEGHISLIRTPFLENSDSFPSRISRRTQWRNPFPLILNLKINYPPICYLYVHRKYGVLHSPLLKGFRPRNLQVKKNVYLTIQSSIYSSIRHRHKRFLLPYEHM